MVVFKLYYKGPFQKRFLLYKTYEKVKDLKKDWSDPMFNDYMLHATRETELTGLPVRKRFSYENVLDNDRAF